MDYFLAFIFQLAVWLGLMLADEYAGTLFASIVGSIALAVWVLSWLVELIEPSRVSAAYYTYLLTAWLAPAVSLFAYVLLRGQLDWMTTT